MLKDTIMQDMREAMRSGSERRLSVLRMLAAAIHNREIEKRASSGSDDLSDEETTLVLRSEAKKRRDSVAQFEAGGRPDLARKESEELAILEGYLPRELPEDHIARMIEEVAGSMPGVGEKDFGRVMGSVMARVKGQASGDRVGALVKKRLAHG